MDSHKKEFAIRLKEAREGRVFEGIGSITSNGMSKLLMDYPEEQRSEMMNLLFKPDYGASLHHLKVEIGSDVNTSSGTEPSHMRSRENLNIRRGYGLPIARIAKDIHPGIILDALRWGTPRWIESYGDKLAYYLNFLKGAREAYGLEFDYLGPDINEGAFDRDWTVHTLLPGLQEAGFGSVRLVADDSDHGWEIAELAATDPELFRAVHAYGVHYRQDSTDCARASGKPLWLSEDLAPFRHSFVKGPLAIARRITDMYAVGRMVKYELHPMVEAEYENTPFSFKSILTAAWPWSGYYQVEPGLWVIAHFTQFIKPGWVYLDDACGSDGAAGYVTLRNPETGDVTLIAVNTGPDSLRFAIDAGELGEGAAGRGWSVWRSDEREQFVQDSRGLFGTGAGALTLEVPPYSICTASTTRGQRKGGAALIPQETDFPLPYGDDFSRGRRGGNPLYFSDQGGAFELDADEDGPCLRQQLTESQVPVDWTYRKTPEPYTLVGSLEWVNYRIGVDVRLEETGAGYAGVGGRISYTSKSSEPPEGYWLKLAYNGIYELKKGLSTLAQGRIEPPEAGSWHRLELVFLHNRITGCIDGETVAEVEDSGIAAGHGALLSSYHRTAYRNFAVEPADDDTPASCLRYDDKHPALRYSGSWTAADGDYNTCARTLTCSGERGAAVSFTFTGVSLSVIGKQAPDGGMAELRIDGEYCGTADWYQAKPGFRKSLFRIHGLASDRPHEALLTVLDRRHPDSQGTIVALDGIEIIGGGLTVTD